MFRHKAHLQFIMKFNMVQVFVCCFTLLGALSRLWRVLVESFENPIKESEIFSFLCDLIEWKKRKGGLRERERKKLKSVLLAVLVKTNDISSKSFRLPSREVQKNSIKHSIIICMWWCTTFKFVTVFQWQWRKHDYLRGICHHEWELGINWWWFSCIQPPLFATDLFLCIVNNYNNSALVGFGCRSHSHLNF